MPRVPHLRLNSLYLCLIVLIGGLIYANSLQNKFIFDDGGFIIHNSSIRHPLALKAVVNYNPRRWVGTWSFAFNYALGGLNVRGYHLVNILIHLTCGLMVWWLFCLILSAPRFCTLPLAAEKEKLAFWAALVFITHPVQTMAVDHITQRYVSLGAFFYLTSLCLYFKGRLLKVRGSWGFFLASGLSGLLGIFSRETVVTLPLAMVLCEIFILNGLGKISIGNRKCWLLVGSFIFIPSIGILFYHLNIPHLLVRVHYYSQSHQGETITVFNYFLTQFRVIFIYIRLLFWPVGLNFDYDIPLSYSFWEPDVFAGCLLIILLLVYALRIRIKYPFVSFGIFWFFLTLSLESTFFPISYVINEYRLYLPLFGFCIGFVTVMRALVKDRRAYTILMGIIVLILSILTIQRNWVYKDEVSLWADTIKQSPYKSRPYALLGSSYVRLGEYSKAVGYLQKALALEPDRYDALSSLAVVYANTGLLDKAIAIDERLLRMHPRAPLGYNNLGLIYYTKGDLNKAEEYFIKSLHVSASYQEAYFNLAKVYIQEGRIEDAEKTYLNIISKFPHENGARYALIQVYLDSKRIPQAEAMAKFILASKDNDPLDLVNVGSVFANKGNIEMALVFFSEAVRLDYTYPGSYIEMGKLFYDQHRLDDAIHIWQMGLKYTSDIETFKNLIIQAQKH